MICRQPLEIQNKIEKSRRYKPQHYNEFLSVPCGWCIPCRINKQQMIIQSGKHYFYKEMQGTGAYLTLTYSPEMIIKNTVTGKDRETRFTAKYKDGVNFIKRVREYCRRHKLYDEKNIFKKNKYVMATEYGEEKGRCHIHIVLMGMDYKVCEQIFRKHWQNGYIKIRPIRNGAIRYITDYLMKGSFGEERKEWENTTNCEAPKCKHSIGLSKEFIEKNLNNIIKNKGVFKENNKTIIIPKYWLNKYNIYKNPLYFEELKTKMQTHQYTNKQIMNIQIRNKFRTEQNEIAIRNFIYKSRNQGKAQKNEFYQENNKKMSEINLFAKQALDRDKDNFPNWVPF